MAKPFFPPCASLRAAALKVDFTIRVGFRFPQHDSETNSEAVLRYILAVFTFFRFRLLLHVLREGGAKSGQSRDRAEAIGVVGTTTHRRNVQPTFSKSGPNANRPKTSARRVQSVA